MHEDLEEMQAELRGLYQEIADLTKPKCGECNVPYACCQPDVCELIAQFAKEDGIELPPRTDHPRLPFMGPEGCILEPYQRPLCALHVCEKHTWEPRFRAKYYDLRARIAVLEHEIDVGGTGI